MNGFLGQVPAIRLRLRNLLFKVQYPSGGGSLEAVVDTGYEGFLAVPPSIFDALLLDKMMTRPRTIEVADGRKVRSKVAYGTVELEGVKDQIDGPVETMEGLSEVLVGTHLLSDFRLTLDYCMRVLSIHPCG